MRPYSVLRRLLDISICILALPFLILFSIVLSVINTFANPGPLLFSQERMGLGGKRFIVYKYRTMTSLPLGGQIDRGPFDPLEKSRITKLGSFLRKTRIDELPQLFNILKNEMTLIGPRPDFYRHAEEYLFKIPRYGARYAIKPGITGLSQVMVGYVEDERGIRRKVAGDLFYIEHYGPKIDAYIIWRTVVIIVFKMGR